jgi:peroxiredoxin Q/BCP
MAHRFRAHRVIERVRSGISRTVSQLRTIAVTIVAAIVGIVNMATRRDESAIELLHLGDAAPDFTLPGSDARLYRLRDFRGQQAVVVAWFPKAFTGG